MHESPKTYVADDGTEFAEKADAERHDALTEAERNLENAQESFCRALMQSQRTADGFLFEFRVWSYYRVVDTWGSMPSVQRVSLGLHTRNIVIDSENRLEFRLWQESTGQHQPGFWMTIRFDELFRDERAAQVACLDAQRERLAEMEADIADYEKRISRC